MAVSECGRFEMIIGNLDQADIRSLLPDNQGVDFLDTFLELFDEIRIRPGGLGDVIFFCNIGINGIHADVLAFRVIVEKGGEHVFEQQGIAARPGDQGIDFLIYRIRIGVNPPVEVGFEFLVVKRRPEQPDIRQVEVVKIMCLVVAGLEGAVGDHPVLIARRFRNIDILHRPEEDGQEGAGMGGNDIIDMVLDLLVDPVERFPGRGGILR